MRGQQSDKSNYVLDLEHSMGYNGNIKKSVLLHPNLKEYVYIAGASVLISEMNDSNNQNILKGHDDEVTCVAISSSGKYIASGNY
jgi:cilia- and flagella-associated protein 52